MAALDAMQCGLSGDEAEGKNFGNCRNYFCKILTSFHRDNNNNDFWEMFGYGRRQKAENTNLVLFSSFFTPSLIKVRKSSYG